MPTAQQQRTQEREGYRLAFLCYLVIAEAVNAVYVTLLLQSRGADERARALLVSVLSSFVSLDDVADVEALCAFAFAASLLWDVVYLYTGVRAAAFDDTRAMHRHVGLAVVALPALPFLARHVDAVPNIVILLLRLVALWHLSQYARRRTNTKAVSTRATRSSSTSASSSSSAMTDRVMFWAHVALIVNYVAELAYAGYMVFSTCGNGLPLFGQVATISPECFLKRRWYALEFWVACGGFALYLAALSAQGFRFVGGGTAE